MRPATPEEFDQKHSYHRQGLNGAQATTALYHREVILREKDLVALDIR